MRDWSIALVVSIPQRPRVPHQAKEPARQLMDAILLTEVQGLLGEQFSPQANSSCSGLNKVERRQLIHAACSNQRDLRKRDLKCAHVLDASYMTRRKNLDKIRTRPPTLVCFGFCQEILYG